MIDALTTHDATGRIRVENVRGKTRLTAGHVPAPLKLLNPGAPGEWCHLVLSNYGGGFLQTDRIALDLCCDSGTRMLLGSQANTRIYRSEKDASGDTEGPTARFSIDAELGDGALAIALPDPVVPHAESRFRQRQHWRLAPSARLVLAETFAAGRLGTGERFAFADFDSEVRISVGGRLILLDRFGLGPARQDPAAPGAFGENAAMLSVYLIGAELEPLARGVDDAAEAGGLPHGCTRVKQEGWLVRVLGPDVPALAPARRRLAEALSSEDFLGFNPLTRKSL